MTMTTIATTTTADRIAPRPPLLIVDDDLPFVGTIERLLQKHYLVDIVHRTEEALMRFRSGERFDAIVCALHLSGTTGLDLHTALLEPSPDQARAMVFIVNKPPTRETQQFILRMADRCIRRPFEISALKAVIAANLRPA